MRDNVVSKVGQLIYRFSAVNQCAPTHVMLGRAQLAELTVMLESMPRREVREVANQDDTLRGMFIVRVDAEDYCSVAKMGHMGHEE